MQVAHRRLLDRRGTATGRSATGHELELALALAVAAVADLGAYRHALGSNCLGAVLHDSSLRGAQDARDTKW